MTTTLEPRCPLCVDASLPTTSQKFDLFDDVVLYFGEEKGCSKCGRPITAEGLAVTLQKRLNDILTPPPFVD